MGSACLDSFAWSHHTFRYDGRCDRAVQNAVGRRGIAHLFVQRETALQRSSSTALAPAAVTGKLRRLKRQQLQPQWVTVAIINPTGRT